MRGIPMVVRVFNEKYTYGSKSDKWEVYQW